MSVNERVEILSGDIAHEQLAPSQANRTEYYPGKATSRAGDMNFEKDFRIPVGTSNFGGEATGPVEMTRSRVVKLGRNIICDQTISAPIITGVRIEPRTEAGVCGTNTTTDTVTPKNLNEQERDSGYDNIKGA